MPRRISRTQITNMSYPQAWNKFRRHRRLPGIPRVLVPAILSDSNDNKTIHYTAAHEIICRGCIDRDNNVPQDVLIAPESNGIEWSCALGIHLIRYAHLTPLRTVYTSFPFKFFKKKFSLELLQKDLNLSKKKSSRKC